MSQKAAIYCRVSTHEQTIEQQQYACQKWCEQNGFEYVVFAEEGVSGAKVSRTQLDLMMQRVRQGEFKAVVVWKLDRLGRNTMHLLQLSEEFRNKRVQLVSTTQNIDTIRPEGRMFFTIIASFAELEREYIMQRVKASMDTKIRKGIKLGRPKGCKDKKPRRKSGYYLYHAQKPHKGDSYYKRERREEAKQQADKVNNSPKFTDENNKPFWRARESENKDLSHYKPEVAEEYGPEAHVVPAERHKDQGQGNDDDNAELQGHTER